MYVTDNNVDECIIHEHGSPGWITGLSVAYDIVPLRDMVS